MWRKQSPGGLLLKSCGGLPSQSFSAAHSWSNNSNTFKPRSDLSNSNPRPHPSEVGSDHLGRASHSQPHFERGTPFNKNRDSGTGTLHPSFKPDCPSGPTKSLFKQRLEVPVTNTSLDRVQGSARLPNSSISWENQSGPCAYVMSGAYCIWARIGKSAKHPAEDLGLWSPLGQLGLGRSCGTGL
jgi:hypothetical protein